jgi:hypothetical protein
LAHPATDLTVEKDVASDNQFLFKSKATLGMEGGRTNGKKERERESKG